MDSVLSELNVNRQMIVTGIVYCCLFISSLIMLVYRVVQYGHHPFHPAPLTARLRRRAWNGVETSQLFGLYFMIYFLAMLSGRFFYSEQIPFVQVSVTVLIWIIILFAITVINRLRAETWESGFGLGVRRMRRLYQAANYYMISMAPILFVTWIFNTLFLSLGMDPELQSPVKMIMEAPPLLRVLLIGLATIGAPIFEEILFRGILFPYLLRKMPLSFAMVLTSFIFAAIHFHLPSFVPIFALSLALCFAYWRTGSLWVSIGMHALFNTISTLAILLMTS